MVEVAVVAWALMLTGFFPSESKTAVIQKCCLSTIGSSSWRLSILIPKKSIALWGSCITNGKLAESWKPRSSLSSRNFHSGWRTYGGRHETCIWLAGEQVSKDFHIISISEIAEPIPKWAFKGSYEKYLNVKCPKYFQTDFFKSRMQFHMLNEDEVMESDVMALHYEFLAKEAIDSDILDRDFHFIANECGKLKDKLADIEKALFKEQLGLQGNRWNVNISDN